MSIAVHKSKIICELEEKIDNDYKVILYNLNNENIFKGLCDAVKNRQYEVEIWTSMNCSEESLGKNIKSITKDDMEEIIEIYHLYEFTDKLLVLSDNPVYPGMMNYIAQGLITERELIDAFTYKL